MSSIEVTINDCSSTSVSALHRNGYSLSVNQNSGITNYKANVLKALFKTLGGNATCVLDTVQVQDNSKSKLKLVQEKIVTVQEDGSLNIDTSKTPGTNVTYQLVFDLIGSVAKDNGNSATQEIELDVKGAAFAAAI